MRLIRLEDAVLYKIIKTIGDDGDTIETHEKINDYKVEIQYIEDTLDVNSFTYRIAYASEVDKVLRVASIRNELETYLLPKNNNKEDNISNYLLEYKGENYRILKVTPKYIHIAWR